VAILRVRKPDDTYQVQYINTTGLMMYNYTPEIAGIGPIDRINMDCSGMVAPNYSVWIR
jgi:hypothetical protein